MAEEKKEAWLNYMALSTVVLAVCATLSTFKGGSYSTRSVMSQTLASDQWAFYQSKSIKGYLYEMEKARMELELKSMTGKGSGTALDDYRQKIADYEKKIAKYEGERGAIQKEAKRFEQVRDDALRHSQAFGIAVIFLQIAILISSIAALIKKRYVWILGLMAGIAGIVYFADGFLLFF